MRLSHFARVGLIISSVCLGSCGGGGSGISQASGVVPAASPSPSATPVQSTTPAGGSSLALTPGVWAPTNLALNVTTAVAAQNITNQPPTPINVSISGASLPRSTVSALHLQTVQSGGGTLTASRTVTREGRPVTSAMRNAKYYVAATTDLQYYGGAVLSSTVSNNIFVLTNYNTCDVTSCWGPYGPSTVENVLSNSTWIHYIDQYIGSNAASRYTAGSSFTGTINLGSISGGYANPVVGLDSLLYMIYSAGVQSGYNGYGHIFHVILPPGIDTCFDLSSSCYSPDHSSTFAFCAYHGSVSFGGLKYLFSIEPYQDVPGCRTLGPSRSGSSDLTDSTASTLAHELIETITDPDVGTGWLDSAGNEVGDRCATFKANVSVPPYLYGIQYVYSDVDHACIGG